MGNKFGLIGSGYRLPTFMVTGSEIVQVTWTGVRSGWVFLV